MANEIALYDPGVVEVIDALADGGNISYGVLPSIDIPSGKGTKFTINPDDEMVSDIKVVLLHAKTRRKCYLPGHPDSDRVPDCISWDGVTGVGNPGGDCASCQWSQWDSAVDAKTGKQKKGKQCAEVKYLVVQIPGYPTPHDIAVPKGSLSFYNKRGEMDINSYLRSLLIGNKEFGRRKPWEVVTRMSIITATSGGGYEYPRVVFTLDSALPDEERDMFLPLVNKLGEVIR